MSSHDPPGSGLEMLRDPAILRILANPSRMRIYNATVQEAVSAKELSDRFQQPLARVSYHMRTLADAGLLRAVRHTQRRGAVETHYRAIATLDLSDELMEEAGPEALAHFAEAMVRDVAEDTIEALGAGAADADDFLLLRAHFTATPAGRKRLYAEVTAFYDRLRELAGELREEAGAEAPEEVCLTIGLYEGTRDAERNRPFMFGSLRDARGDRYLPIPPAEEPRA